MALAVHLSVGQQMTPVRVGHWSDMPKRMPKRMPKYMRKVVKQMVLAQIRAQPMMLLGMQALILVRELVQVLARARV